MKKGWQKAENRNNFRSVNFVNPVYNKEAVSKAFLRQFFYKTFGILKIILYIYA
jgi:hypothetical protein